MSRFRWAGAARIVDAAGQSHGPGNPADCGCVLAPRPAVAALQAVTGAPAFRIGGEGPVPQGEAVFETLSGGSSGTPRRIRRSQQSWIAGFTVNAGLFGIGPGMPVAVIGNLVHSLALYGALEALHLGAELHMLEPMRPDHQARALAARRVALLYATPAQLRGLLVAGVDWPDLRRVLVGGSRLDPELRTALAQRTGAQITEFYGAAETSFISLADADCGPESVGRPYPGVEIDLRQGQIWVRSPYLAEGYSGEPGSALWSGGWVCPGETGRIEAGELILAGRISRRVKIADVSVQPEAIEAWLLARPGVLMAAVVPRPDARRGHILVACLQGDPAQEADLLTGLRGRFGPLVAPRRICWLRDWPVLPSGKTDYPALEAFGP